MLKHSGILKPVNLPTGPYLEYLPWHMQALEPDFLLGRRGVLGSVCRENYDPGLLLPVTSAPMGWWDNVLAKWDEDPGQTVLYAAIGGLVVIGGIIVTVATGGLALPAIGWGLAAGGALAGAGFGFGATGMATHDPGAALQAGAIGAVAGAVGGATFGYFAPAAGALLAGVASGMTAGFTGGFVGGLAAGQNVWEALESGRQGALVGAATAGVLAAAGAAIGGIGRGIGRGIGSAAGWAGRTVRGWFGQGRTAVQAGSPGRFGGILYGTERLAKLGRYLARREIRLLVTDELPDAVHGYFSGKMRTMILRSDATRYEVWHELLHYRQFRQLGPQAYGKLARPMGPEQYAYNALRTTKRWDMLTKAEQIQADAYILKSEGYRIDIDGEYVYGH